MEAQIYERMEELKNVDLDIGVKRKNIEFQKVREDDIFISSIDLSILK